MSTGPAIETDVIVVGGGIAGASAAAEIASHRRVVLVERESRPGYHTTGRSAALLTPFYGNELVRALNLAGAAFYHAPPPGFSEAPLLRPRGALYIAKADQADQFATELAATQRLCPEVHEVGAAGAIGLVPALRADYVAHAFLDPTAADLEVGAVLEAYLRRLSQRGGKLLTDAEVTGLARTGAHWEVATRAGRLRAAVLVNAAGAWADPLAELAGLKPLGITPLRRTAILVDPPEGLVTDDWPVVADLLETFYVKPDAGRLLCSPADETPTTQSDVQPEELDVAICVERVEQAMTLNIRHIRHRWAGLRNFAPDRTPVLGPDPRAEGFFWLAGQGGYGIMTAPPLAALMAHSVVGAPLPEGLRSLDLGALPPARLLSTL